jgi:glucosyl-dolichyl phosphate glucuronosyltransferase
LSAINMPVTDTGCTRPAPKLCEVTAAIKVTVVLCTYNRCEILAKALESAASLKLADSVEWEVLVVDNNSKDQTRDVVEQFCQRYPGRFRYLFEAQPGKSHALNAGIRAAEGNVLAFLDDDVTVDQHWLQNLTAPLHNGPWAGVGGRTLLAESYSPPPWLAFDGPYGMGGIFAALFDLGDEPCELKSPPYGTNMAFQKSAFKKCGEFRTDLGPSPDPEIPRPNEDTEFGRRVIAAGGKLRYEPTAVVYHRLPDERISQDYFLNWWFDCGRASVRELGKRPNVWGIPRHHLSMIRSVCMFPVEVIGWTFTWRTQKRFYRKCWVWKAFGQIAEMYRRRRGRKQIGNFT